jgi:hypothetical protein
MTDASHAMRVVWAILYRLAGMGFFFAIIGVFGLTTAIVGLLLFVAAAIFSIVLPSIKEN